MCTLNKERNGMFATKIVKDLGHCKLQKFLVIHPIKVFSLKYFRFQFEIEFLISRYFREAERKKCNLFRNLSEPTLLEMG